MSAQEAEGSAAGQQQLTVSAACADCKWADRIPQTLASNVHIMSTYTSLKYMNNPIRSILNAQILIAVLDNAVKILMPIRCVKDN